MPTVDGEKDPRCLLLSFDAVQALLALYHAQPHDSLCRQALEVRRRRARRPTRAAHWRRALVVCQGSIATHPRPCQPVGPLHPCLAVCAACLAAGGRRGTVRGAVLLLPCHIHAPAQRPQQARLPAAAAAPPCQPCTPAHLPLPPPAPRRITREQLACGLEAVLAAEPLFAPYVVPLATEKLGSTLRQAKLDAMSLLGACAAGYGPAPLAAHASTIWRALRAELAAPAAEGLLPADLAAADELAGAAEAALARCISAFQQPSDGSAAAGARLADAMLADSLLQDVLPCIRAPGRDAALHRRGALHTKAGVRAARALCSAGGLARAQALAQLLPPLLALGSGVAVPCGSGGWQTQCLAWAALLDLLEASATAPADVLPSGLDGALVQQAVAAAAASLAAAAAEQAASAAHSMEGEAEGEDAEDSRPQTLERWPLIPGDCTRERATALQLRVLATSFDDPGQTAALQRQQVEAALAAILQLVAAAGSNDARQQAAVAPLTALAGSSQAAVLAEQALPQLVAAAAQQASAPAALVALQALASANSSLQLGIVAALDEGIQEQLPAAAAEAGEGGGNSTALLLQLLAAATGIVAAPAASAATATAPVEASCFLQLGRHLFDAVVLLPQQSAAHAGPDLAAACAELAYHATRAAPAEQQQPLAAAAADTLLEQQPAGLLACVSCALLVPLRPGAANACAPGQLAALVQRLVQLALQQPADALAGRWAALAAAALLNKWDAAGGMQRGLHWPVVLPAMWGKACLETLSSCARCARCADAEGLAACAAHVLSQQLLPACGLADSSSGLPAAAPAAWGCLTAVSRGLAMRGHKEGDAVLARVVSSLNGTAQQWQQADAAAQQGLAAGAMAAARLLGAALDGTGSIDGAPAAGSAAPGVNKQSHATAKPLWQQRLYTAASRQLLPLLQHSQQVAPSSGEPAPLQASPVLLLALGHLLRVAPGGVQQQEQARMLPWMLQCLAGLQEGPLADGQLLLALLLLVSDALISPAGGSGVGHSVPTMASNARFLGGKQSHACMLPTSLSTPPPAAGKAQAEADLLPRLVPTLLGLARFQPLPAVRETALQCLLLLLDLPYTALHPYRPAVARVLAAAVDDNRRAVRLQAARCRAAWAVA